MKHATKLIILALWLGWNASPPASARSAGTFFSRAVSISEGAMTLNDAAGVAAKIGSFFGSSSRISVAIEIADWSRSITGYDHGQPYMSGFYYRHFPVLLSSFYVHRWLANGVIETDYEPFPVTSLELRDMTCRRGQGARTAWETRRARFTMAARSTLIEKVGWFSDGLGPWPCTVVMARSPMPSGCSPVEDEETQERRAITVRTGSLTYFTFDRSGNYLYGLPGILIGDRMPARPAPPAPNPIRIPEEFNDPIRSRPTPPNTNQPEE